MATKKESAAKKTAEKKKASTPKKAEKPVKTAKAESVDSNVYPIGKFKMPEELTDTVINKLIQDIRILPEHLREVKKKIKKKKQLQYTYRDGGWTIEQIIHHIADSHMNAFIRFKLTLTENNPTVKPYDENLWTETADVQLPVKVSVKLLKALHTKWVALLENMDRNDWKRTYFHPEYKRTFTLAEILPLYAWHGKHHVAQIEVALKNN